MRLLSVPQAIVERFRQAGTPLEPTSDVACSPLLTQFLELEPLRTLLAIAVESGQPLRDGLWSAERTPSVHSADEVQTLSSALADAWVEAEQTPAACDDFFVGEIRRVVQLFGDAAARGDAVVVLIAPVLDGEGGPEVRVVRD